MARPVESKQVCFKCRLLEERLLHVDPFTHKYSWYLSWVLMSSSKSNVFLTITAMGQIPVFHRTYFLFNKLSVSRTPHPHFSIFSSPSLGSLHWHWCFISDIQSSRLIASPPKSLGSLLISCSTTLSSLLDKHSTIISKLSKCRTKSSPLFMPAIHTFQSKVHHTETVLITLILLSLGYLSSLSKTATTT